MIKPTIGRVVWFTPAPSQRIDGQPNDQQLAAIVSYVWNDRMVNLMAITPNGVPFGVTSVQLLQDGDPRPPAGYYFAEWMPYQKGQAAKNEQLEQKLAAGS